MARHLQSRGESFGLLWFDAPADVNVPESTLSGDVHGLALALAEINPVLDERNTTASLALELALSALGKRVF